MKPCQFRSNLECVKLGLWRPPAVSWELSLTRRLVRRSCPALSIADAAHCHAPCAFTRAPIATYLPVLGYEVCPAYVKVMLRCMLQARGSILNIN